MISWAGTIDKRTIKNNILIVKGLPYPPILLMIYPPNIVPRVGAVIQTNKNEILTSYLYYLIYFIK